MSGWGVKVLNFLVKKKNILLFVLQTSRNVLKRTIHTWGGYIWPFYDDLMPQFFTVTQVAVVGWRGSRVLEFCLRYFSFFNKLKPFKHPIKQNKQ